MNWPRIILDGLSMSLLFNAVVGLGFLLVPQAYSTMFPKEIKEAAAPYVERKDVRVMHWIIYPLYLVLVLYWAVSACFAETRGFWPLFWTGYVEMTFVSISDFLILDCWLPPKAKAFDIIALDYILITKTQFFQHYIPETKGCAGYHSFGHNRKEQLTRILTLIWIAGAAIVSGIIVLLF